MQKKKEGDANGKGRYQPILIDKQYDPIPKRS